MTPAQQPEHYALTRWGLEEYYDALAHINGRAYADQMWERIERDTRTRPHTPAPDTDRHDPRIELRRVIQQEEHDAAVARAATLATLDTVVSDIEKMIDAEQERGTDGNYSKDSITKLGILAYVSEHFKSLRSTAQERYP